MRLKKILSLLLAMTMLFSCVGITAMAEGTDVAKIDDESYATLADALAAASTMAGDVTVEVYDKVTLNTSISGSYDSIKFIGMEEDAEIYLDVQGYITANGKAVTFEDLTLSKSAGGFITNAGFMNVAFGVYEANTVTYTNCTFANGAYASSGENTFTGCTFKRSHEKYGLWAYGDVEAVVDGCKFDDYRGIKTYAEGAAKTVNLTVKNTDFSAVNDKPAIVLTYGKSITLENNTYSSTGVFELDLDGAPNGTSVTSDIAPTCKNDNGACGVLVDGKIYTTVAQAAAVAESGSEVILLHNSIETVEFAEGVILKKNGFEAEGITVKSKVPSGSINGGLVNLQNAERTFLTIESWITYANESIVVKVYDANDTLLVTSSLVDNNRVILGKENWGGLSTFVGINCTDGWWNVEWEEGKLSADYVPAKATLFIDGVEMNTAVVQMRAAGSETAVDWATVPGVPSGSVKVATKAELDAAIAAAQEGDTILLTADIDYTGTSTLTINKAITLDLGGKTLTTYGTYGGLRLMGDCSIKNGTLAHKGTVTAIKAWNVERLEDLVITVAERPGKTVGGIVIQENAAGIKTIKNVTIKGEGLTNGIETYNCGNATSPVIGSMENVTIDAKSTGMLISAPCGTATNCNIKGGTTGIELWIKGTYSASLGLKGCTVDGDEQALFIHDEFTSNAGAVNNGTLELTADDETTFENEKLVMTIARAENLAIDDDILKMRSLQGAGTAEKPYIINNLNDLKWFRDDVNAGNTYNAKYVKLAADIDLKDETWTPIAKFEGVFDGDNKTISNLVVNGGRNKDQGFFAVTMGGEIKNITFNNAKVTGRLDVGVVAGTPYTSKYTNIKVTGHVEVNGMAYVGGVGGKNAYADWTDITVDVDESSYVKAISTENGSAYRTYVGGVIGFMGEGGHTVKNVTSNINVIGDVCDIGGIVGIAHYGNNFENVVCTGNVTNTNTDAADSAETGGIAGVWHNQKGYTVTFTKCSFTGKVTATGVAENAAIGAAYDATNNSETTSGSLIIDGETAWPKSMPIKVTYKDGSVEYFVDMIDAVPYTTNCPKLEGATITLLDNVSGQGMRFMENDMVFDLNGFTFTITAGTGSQGTNTSGFQIRPEVTTNVIFKNGTINVQDGAPVVWMFNCYATDFIVEDVTVDCANMAWSYGESCYAAVSRSEDNIQLKGTTKIINFNSEVAGDAYSIGGTMTVEDTVVLGGRIQLDEGATLTAGENVDVVADEGCIIKYENGVYTAVEKVNVAAIGEVKYETLAKAFDAANDGDTITLISDVEMTDSVVISGKTLTLDLGGYTIYDKNTKVLTSNDDIWGLIALKDGAKLTVCGNGKIECNYTGTTGGWTGMVFAFDVDATSELTVDNGYFTNGNGVIQTRGKVTVNNGTFVSHNGGTCIMAVDSVANVTVNDGVFKDSVGDNDVNTGSGAVWAGFGATVNINGGSYDFAPDPSNENVVWTLFPAQNAIAGYGENAKMTVRGGTFVNFNPATDVIVDYSQSAGFTYGSVVAEGYAAIPNLNGNYVVGTKPTATVNNLGAMVIPAGGYNVYGNGSNNVDMPLSFVMQFLADQDEADMATSPYADWYADFVITFDGLENSSFVADGCYLAGFYGDFGWVKVPVDGMTIEDGVRYPVMLGVGLGQKYNYVCSGVQDFKCALYLTPEVLAANPNLKVNLELAVVDNSKGQGAATTALVNNKNIYEVVDYNYNADDFVLKHVAAIGEEKYKSLEDAIAAAEAGNTIILLADVTEDVIIDKNLTIDGANFKYTGNISVSGNTTAATVKNVNFVDGTGYAITTNRIKSITVEDCTVTNYGYGFLYANKSTPTVNVKNVTVSGGNYGFHWVYGTTATLENVTMTDVTNGLLIQNYAGKTVTLKNCNLSNINIWERDGYSGVQTFKFEGSNTVSSLSTSQYAKYVLAAADATLTAPEDFNVTTDLKGYIVKYVDGVYKVVEAVAQIGEEKYETLADAIAAAQAGDTITVIDDIVLENTVNVPADKTITLDLNGKTITGTPAEAKAYATINNKGNLTINDTVGTGKILCNHTLAGSTSYAVNTIVNSGTLAVNGGTIENTSTASNQIGYAIDNNSTTGNAVVTVNGGEIKASGSNYYDGIRQFCNSTTLENSVVVNDGSVSSIWMQNPSDGSSDRNTKDVKGSVTVTGGNVMGLYLEPSASFEASVTGGNIGTLSAFETAEGRDLVGFVSGGTFATKPDDAYAAEGHVFEKNADGTWGVTEKEAVELFELRGANVKLGSDLTMFFYIPKAELESGVDYYATITKANVGEEATVVNVQMSEWENYSDDLYRVAFDDIMAYMMNDKIEVQIFDNDGTAVSDIWTDSISIYAHRIYTNQNNKFKTALVDMLNYGAACQKYFGYDAENLANKDLTDEQKNMASVDPPLTDSRVKGDNYYGSSVTCDSTLILQFYFENINETMTAKITYTDAYNEEITETIDGSKFNKRTNTLTGVKVGLAAYDAQQLVKCEVYDGDTLVASAVDSVESYVARMASTDDVYATIMKFALSSKSALTQK